jgi:hypothetical protein
MRSTRNTIAAALLFSMALASSAFAVLQTHRGKAVAAVTVVTESELSFIGSTSFQNLGGTTITVPAGKVQLVRVEFSGDSQCQGSFAENWCQVRILADGAEMNPISGGDYAFDGVGNADDFAESHLAQGSTLLGPGRHTIQVQAAVTLSGMAFYIDDWTLAITQYNNGR